MLYFRSSFLAIASMPVLINGLTSIYKFVFQQKQSVLGRNIPIISPDDPQNESF